MPDMTGLIRAHRCRQWAVVLATVLTLTDSVSLKTVRGNICPVTIIMPTLAMEAIAQDEQDPVEYFMSLLDTRIHDAKDMLIERFEYICSQDASSAKFMYENGTMAG